MRTICMASCFLTWFTMKLFDNWKKLLSCIDYLIRYEWIFYVGKWQQQSQKYVSISTSLLYSFQFVGYEYINIYIIGFFVLCCIGSTKQQLRCHSISRDQKFKCELSVTVKFNLSKSNVQIDLHIVLAFFKYFFSSDMITLLMRCLWNSQN